MMRERATDLLVDGEGARDTHPIAPIGGSPAKLKGILGPNESGASTVAKRQKAIPPWDKREALGPRQIRHSISHPVRPIGMAKPTGPLNEGKRSLNRGQAREAIRMPSPWVEGRGTQRFLPSSKNSAR